MSINNTPQEVLIEFGTASTLPILNYEDSRLLNNDVVTVDFLSKDATTLTFTGTYKLRTLTTPANIVFTTPMTIEQVNMIKLATREYIEVKKAGVLNGQIRVQIRDKKIGFGKNPCNDALLLDEASTDPEGECDDILSVVGTNSTGTLEKEGKMVYTSGDMDISANEVDGNLVLDFAFTNLDPLTIPTTTPPLVTGDTPSIKGAVEKLQSQINTVNRNRDRGDLPNGNASKTTPTVLLASTMPLSTLDGDYYNVPTTAAAGWFTLPDGTVEKLTVGDKVVYNKFTNTYSVSPAGDNQIASEVSYTNTTSGLVANNVQSAIDELANKNIPIKTKTALDTTDRETFQLVNGKERFYVDKTGTSLLFNPPVQNTMSPMFRTPTTISSTVLTGVASQLNSVTITKPQNILVTAKMSVMGLANTTIDLESYIEVFDLATGLALGFTDNVITGGPLNIQFGDERFTFVSAGATTLARTVSFDIPAGNYMFKFTAKYLSGNSVQVGDQGYIIVTHTQY